MSEKTYQEQQKADAQQVMADLTNAVMVDDKELGVTDRELLERMSRVLLLIAEKVYADR